MDIRIERFYCFNPKKEKNSQGGNSNARSGIGGSRRRRRCRTSFRRLCIWPRRWHVDDDRSRHTLSLRVRISPARNRRRDIFCYRVSRTLWKTLQGDSFQFLGRLLGGSESRYGDVNAVRILFVNVVVYCRSALLLLEKSHFQNYHYFFLSYSTEKSLSLFDGTTANFLKNRYLIFARLNLLFYSRKFIPE